MLNQWFSGQQQGVKINFLLHYGFTVKFVAHVDCVVSFGCIQQLWTKSYCVLKISETKWPEPGWKNSTESAIKVHVACGKLLPAIVSAANRTRVQHQTTTTTLLFETVAHFNCNGVILRWHFMSALVLPFCLLFRC